MTTRLIVGGLLVDRPVLRPPFRFISWRRKAFFVLQALFSSDEFLSLALFCWNLLLHKCSERSWKQKGLDKPLRPCKLSHVANWGLAGKEYEDSRNVVEGGAAAVAAAVLPL